MGDLARIIGERLRNIRKQRGISQEELSHLASLHTTYIGQLERGEKNATIETLEKITGALQVNLEELFRFVQPTTEEQTTVILSQIINRIQGKSLADQKMVLKLIDMLLEWKDSEN